MTQISLAPATCEALIILWMSAQPAAGGTRRTGPCNLTTMNRTDSLFMSIIQIIGLHRSANSFKNYFKISILYSHSFLFKLTMNLWLFIQYLLGSHKMASAIYLLQTEKLRAHPLRSNWGLNFLKIFFKNTLWSALLFIKYFIIKTIKIFKNIWNIYKSDYEFTFVFFVYIHI